MHSSVTSYNLISVCFNLSHYTTANKMEMNSCTPESSADFDQKKAKKTKKSFFY